MTLILVITIVTIVANTALGLVAFSRNTRRLENRYLFLLALSIVIWITTLFLYYFFSDPSLVLLMGRLNFFSSGFIGFLFASFVYSLARGTTKLPKLITFGLTGLTLIMCVLTMFTPLVDKNEIVQGADRIVEYGPLYPVWVGQLLLGFLLGTVFLIYKLIKSRGILRTQLQLILTGFAFFFAITTITNIVMPAYGNYTGQLFSPLTTIFWIALMTIAIVKHRLFDIHLVLTRAISYALLILFLGLLFVFLTYQSGNYLLKINLTNPQIAVLSILSLIMAFIFQPIRRFFEASTDKLLYKNHYDKNTLLYDLAVIMASTLKIEDLSRYVLIDLIQKMRIRHGTIITLKDDKIYHSYSQNSPIKDIALSQIKELLSSDRLTVFDELPEGNLRDQLRLLNCHVAIPLVTYSQSQGLLLLGEKLSGETYTSEDVQVLQILSPQIAVALQNTKSYHEVSQFNVTLQQEVAKATKDLKEANNRLKDLDRLKDEFVSLVSHDLRTPMTAIKGYVYLLLKMGQELPQKATQKLQIVYDSSERMIRIIADLLDVSRIEAGRLQLNPEKVDVYVLASEIRDQLSPSIQEKSLSLAIEGGKNEYLVVADKARLHQVLTNLIGNSLKFTPEKGSITIRFSKKDKQITTLVVDTGPGISKENLSKLFTKFGKLDTASSGLAQTPGTGLGLYICKKMVELSGGKISVASTPGHGSTFSFTLPIPRS